MSYQRWLTNLILCTILVSMPEPSAIQIISGVIFMVLSVIGSLLEEAK